MDTMPGNDPMEKQQPLAGLDPAELLRQGAAEDTFMEGAANSFDPPPLEELTAIFPQFEILGLIGQGGMGAVYKVRQKALDRIVALKILPPGIGRSPEFSERFTREARALAKLNHPGIVTLHEFGHQDGLYFILMEFVDGVNLAQLMKTGRVSPREALAIVPQICDALQYAHDQGIVHRDIKPENLLLDRQGRVKVADFGIAKVVAAACDPLGSGQTPASGDQTLAGKIIGTPQYMAPEQIEHPSEVDHRADIYALGVVFYQMLTGELPGKDLQAPSRKFQIDVRLDEIVLKALEKNPEQRYQHASVMKTEVDGLRTPAHVQFPAQTKAGRGPMRQRWWVFPLMLPVGLLIGLAAGAMWSYSFPKVYEAQAVMEVRPFQDTSNATASFGEQFEAIKSRQTLTAVADQLELSKRWKIEREEVIRILKQGLTAENIRGTDLISIRVRHESKQDVVDITNAVVRAYQENFAGEVIVHDLPSLPSFPVSRNTRLSLVAGGFSGLILSPLLALMLIKILQRRFLDSVPVIPPNGTELHSNHGVADHAASSARMDPYAIASFALGIGSFILWPLGALPAIVFGHVSRARIRKNPALEGNGFALGGLILGYVFLVASIAIISAMVGFMKMGIPDLTKVAPAPPSKLPMVYDAEALSVPPQLVFIGLQHPSKERWHPDGSPANEPQALAWMREIGPIYAHDMSKGETIRGMEFWFVHPLLEPWQTREIEFLDESGAVATRLGGVNGKPAETSGKEGRLHWSLMATPVDISKPLNVRLNYTLGPLERVKEHIVEPHASGSTFKDGNTVIASVGQTAGGSAFLALAVDEATQSKHRFGVEAVTKDGKIIHHGSWSGGSGPGRPNIITYQFGAPFSEVAKFRIGTRPLRSAVWKNVATSPYTGTPTELVVAAAAEAWLAGIDVGEYGRSWKNSAVFFQKSITEAGWGEEMARFRQPLGEVKSREFVKHEKANALPGAPDGEYFVMQFETSFSSKEKAVETVTFVLEEDGASKACGYYIR